MPDKQESSKGQQSSKEGAKDISVLVEECLANNLKYQKTILDNIFRENMICCQILDESKGCPYISNDAGEDDGGKIYLACEGIKKKEKTYEDKNGKA